jgi:hypothetical protein
MVDSGVLDGMVVGVNVGEDVVVIVGNVVLEGFVVAVGVLASCGRDLITGVGLSGPAQAAANSKTTMMNRDTLLFM